MHLHPVHVGPPAWTVTFQFPVSAGFPSPADDHLDAPIDLTRELIRNPPATFIMKVKGDSAVDAGVADGCLILVDRSLVPRDGDLVVVDVNGARSVKLWRLRDGRPGLAFANRLYPAFDPGPDPEVTVFGVITNAVHRFRR